MHLRAGLHRCRELYQEGGLSEIYRGIRDFLRHDFGRHYQDTRIDNDLRWEFIESHLDEDIESLIDIGCAEGEFCARAASLGIETTGLDRNIMRIETARSRHAEIDNLTFERTDLAPSAIADIPAVDVILFLTVHHHWVRAYGWEDANAMFSTLLEKADMVVYEPPGHLALSEEGASASLDPDSSIDYYTDLLETVFDGSLQIVDATLMEYKSESERYDPVFILDSSDYGS